ncbi:hypothetical protein SNE40_009918 [Patella caerulea]|uniref:Cap-specific mRNA (nucleoside-2'-O-)-methyltransferase 1 n=2 Tax=Patella caerulea TaxID=87958 RepID=A0AAN8JWQ2_PATCE
MTSHGTLSDSDEDEKPSFSRPPSKIMNTKPYKRKRDIMMNYEAGYFEQGGTEIIETSGPVQKSFSDSSEDERPSFHHPTQKMGSEMKFVTKGNAMGDASSVGSSTSTTGSETTGTSESEGEPASKFIKVNTGPKQPVQMNDAVGKMMAKMGYQAGKGLGKHGQGRVEIVEASKQKGRRGLGLFLEGLEAEDVEWNFDLEELIIEETVDWLPKCTLPIPTLDEMIQWKVIGKKKRSIDDETNYISEKTLQGILKSKNVFDICDPEEMRRARTRSNPYETIRGVFFLNRAAMKMANMDAVLDFMFTTPKDPHGKNLVAPNEILYFADICAGPGGFSEYVLWRKKGDSKGFGMTLKGQNDFKLEDFFAGPGEMFEPFYGVGGIDGDGDIFNPDNQDAFTNFVLDNTDGKGVHFVMADGGFSVEGQENIQEILSKQLYLCQCLVALSILRYDGHFVCKLFDLFTPFSMGLVYLMYLAFDTISIFKPVTSRPANSERYIICRNKRAGSERICEYMKHINLDLCKYLVSTSNEDVNEIVPHDTMKDDTDFFDYMWVSNENIGRKQIIGLKKIQAFCQNKDLYENRQSTVRKDCLKYWQVPDEVRAAPNHRDPEGKFSDLMDNDPYDYINHSPDLLDEFSKSHIKSVYDYMCTVRSDQNTYYLLGLGKSHVFKLDRGKWMKVEERIELPYRTLLEAETVQEIRGEGRGQKRIKTIHILDALFLCGKDVRSLHFKERLESLKKFVKAVQKPSRSDLSPLVVSHYYKLEEVDQVFNRLDMKVVKGSQGMPRLCFLTPDNTYYHPGGIYLIKTVKEPWMMSISRSSKRKYWYNTHTKEAVYDCRKESIATARDSKLKSLFWKWEKGVCVHDSQEHIDINKLSRDSFLEFIHRLIPV